MLKFNNLEHLSCQYVFLMHINYLCSILLFSALGRQVDQKLAECISLPDGTKVQVKAVANLPIAGEVFIEPSAEDDWEILELNSEHAEEAILKQVLR